jgi:cytochrome P450
MTHFVPPYPKRHKQNISPLKSLLLARRDLLSIWTEDSFELELMSQKILKQHVFIANSPDLVKEIFVTRHQNYERKSPQMRRALEPLLGDGLFISDGETWAQRRKMQTHLFNAAHIKRYSTTMIDTTEEMVENWAKTTTGESLLVLPEMAKLTAEIISRALFGEKMGAEYASEVVDAFSDYQASVSQMAIPNFLGLPDWFPMIGSKRGRINSSAKRIHDIVDRIIEKAALDPKQDTIATELLAANKAGENINKEQIRNEMIVLFMAGHETTANTLAWFWYLVSQSPTVEKKLHEELDNVLNGALPTYEDVPKLVYTRAILEETMRLYPPVPLLSRQAKHEDVLRNKTIPAGSIMIISPWLIHRHKRYWDKPDHFIPERFMPGAKKPIKFTYLPFSLGPRVCIGKSFGLTESILCTAILAQKYRLTLPQGEKVTHECRLTLRPKGKLPMTLVHR